MCLGRLDSAHCRHYPVLVGAVWQSQDRRQTLLVLMVTPVARSSSGADGGARLRARCHGVRLLLVISQVRTASTGLASGSTGSARPDELDCDTFTTGPLAVTVIPAQSFESLVFRLFRDRGRKIHHGLSHMGRRCSGGCLKYPRGARLRPRAPALLTCDAVTCDDGLG